MRRSVQWYVDHKSALDKRIREQTKAYEKKIKAGVATAMDDLVEDTKKCIYNEYKNAIDYISDVPLSPAESRTLEKHSHNKNSEQSWYSSKTLYNPAATITSKRFIVLAKEDNNEQSASVYVRGADVIYLEYGTGTLGEQDQYPGDLPFYWKYNSGSTIRTDSETGVKYWTYKGISRIGNPAGAFMFNARNVMLTKIKRSGMTFDVAKGTNNFSIKLKKG